MNIVCFGSAEPLVFMTTGSLFSHLSVLLTSPDPNLVRGSLVVLGTTLERAGELPVYEECLGLFEECGGLLSLQKLQGHPNSFLCSLSQTVLTSHFEVEEVDRFEFS
jgi:hypothetical protein